MADLIALQTYHTAKFLPPSSTMRPRHAHKRSLSSEHRALSPDKTVSKAKSTTNLAEIAARADDDQEPLPKFEESSFNTLQDPRLAIESEVSPSTSSSHHPDLSNEVAALSVKLIQAINNQTTLDDNLVAARQELELAQGKVKALEFQNEKYRRDIDARVYIKKADSDREIFRLKTALAEEKAQRAIIEKGKKTIEQELETLTADLFEEANKMVAAAKIEREAVEKKNEQLRSQIKDTELLLASHQDQMAELKSVMQGMNISKDDADTRNTPSTTPPSPAGPPLAQGSAKHEPEVDPFAAAPCDPDEQTPGPSCNFPEILRLFCRVDLQSYEDFRELLELPRSSKPPSRAGSGSYGGLNVMSLAGFGSGGSNTSSPTKGFTHSPNGSLSSQPGSHIPLKDTRFYKRVLMEDIEPTLRLDLAPGISWLTRRTVLSAICEGTLIVEPMPTAVKKFDFPCSVCGERRPGIHNERTHRFRTSDSETAQRYSLCLQCLERVRSCCEFTGYLRLILDGHLRAGDVEEEKNIWEETVRLRERMFWSRIAAGIVPLVSRIVEPEAEPDSTIPGEPHDDHLHPMDHTEIKVKEIVSTQEIVHSDVNNTATEPSTPARDVAKPATPEPRNPTINREDSGSEEPSRRNSIDSEVSVYEEANADVTSSPAEPADQSTGESVIEPTADAAAGPVPEPTVEVATGPADEPVVEHAAEPVLEAPTESVTEATAEPMPVPTVQLVEPAAEFATEPVVDAAPKPAPEAVAQPAAEVVTETTVEPAAEPAAKPDMDLVTETTANPATEPVIEPASEAMAKPAAESAQTPVVDTDAKSAGESVAEPVPQSAAEPATEPAAENTTEPVTESPTELAAAPASKPAAEAVEKPAADTGADPTTKSVAEPTPENATAQSPTHEKKDIETNGHTSQ